MEAQEVPLLVVQEGPLVGHKWPLDRDVTVLGRGEECDIVVPERQVSRAHLRIKRDAGNYVLEDLGSKNGTFVNGRQVQAGTPVRLQDGDEIQVALSVRLVFVGAEATLPLAGHEMQPAACGWIAPGQGAAARLDRRPRAGAAAQPGAIPPARAAGRCRRARREPRRSRGDRVAGGDRGRRVRASH